MQKGTVMSFEFDNNLPIYVQLVEQIKLTIISGKIKCGERLPSVRDLALKNQVNPNTMQKALGELESLGLIYTERTNGKFVTNNQELIDRLKKEYAKGIADNFFSMMENIGINPDEAIAYLKGGNQ